MISTTAGTVTDQLCPITRIIWKEAGSPRKTEEITEIHGDTTAQSLRPTDTAPGADPPKAAVSIFLVDITNRRRSPTSTTRTPTKQEAERVCLQSPPISTALMVEARVLPSPRSRTDPPHPVADTRLLLAVSAWRRGSRVWFIATRMASALRRQRLKR